MLQSAVQKERKKVNRCQIDVDKKQKRVINLSDVAKSSPKEKSFNKLSEVNYRVSVPDFSGQRVPRDGGCIFLPNC